MSRIEEKLTEQFYRWERRGRGWQVFPEPVSPEPPFCPFYGHYVPDAAIIDDGRRPTLLSSFVRRVSRKLSTDPPPAPPVPEEEEEPEPQPLIRDSLIELQTFLSPKLEVHRDEFEQFLFGLSLCEEPVTFELLGTSEHITAQFAIHPGDQSLVAEQLHAFFPDAVFLPRQGALEEAWENTPSSQALIAEFGLAREFMFPLGSGSLDPFVGITGALAALEPRELGLFQVIFQPVRHPWAESVLRSVTHGDGEPFFVNAPELVKEARSKISRPLYAAVVRVGAKSPDAERAWEITRRLASSLGVFARPGSNELIPLTNDEYPPLMHEEDMLRRQSRRCGMLLNSEELIGFVHLPSVEVRSPKLARQTEKTKLAPKAALNPRGLVLGVNIHAGVQTTVALSPEQRVRHMHIIGGSGTGKSTLLFNLIRQDIEGGAGVAVLDPHGDLVDKVLGIIPAARIDDVVLVDPSDEQFPVGFNILSAHSDLEKNLLASDLVSVFERLSTSWGDQMGSVLQNAILAFLESSRGGTLAELRRFLIEPAFRTEFLKTVQDRDVIYYWQKGFPQLSGNKSIGSILTRLGTFLSPKPIRYMVSQPTNRLDFGQIMDTGKIFLAKLAEGLLGEENSHLLGTLLVAKFQQLAMSRQAQQLGSRRDFWIYADEFANFITPSMAQILSGTRKYRIGLTLAHHELHQLQKDPKVASAVMSHPLTRIVFRVGDDDARKLAEGFSFFEATDLKNLETGHAIARIERSDFDFNLAVPLSQEPTEPEAAERRRQVTTASRNKYATPRAEVEAALYADIQTEETKREPVVPERTEKRAGTLSEIEKAFREPPAEEAKPAEPSADQPAEPAKREPPRPPSMPPPTVAPVAGLSKRPAPMAPEPPVPAVRVAKPRAPEPPAPKELGRGGPQHKYLQHLIAQLAMGLNFEVDVEKTILDGKRSVDVALKKGEKRFAFEIASTTGDEHELGKILDYRNAGFDEVVMVCLEPSRLAKLREVASKEVALEDQGRIRFCLPNDLSPLLIELSAASSGKDVVSHGRKTRVTFRPVSEEEARKRRATLADISTKSLKRFKGD